MKRLTPGLVALVGAVARLIPYFRRPSLFYDEAMLSLNVATRSFSGFLHPLDYDQTAPPLYLWLTHAATRVAGVNELALRALPLVAGLLLPLAVWRLGRRLLPDGAALFAGLVVALAPGLVQYSVIVKPYAVDALVTVVLLDAAFEVWTADTRSAWAWLIGLGAVGVSLSTPAAFVLAAIGLALGAARWRTRALPLVTAAAVWIGLFALIYAGIYRASAAGVFMQRFWASDFLTPAAFVWGGRAYGILRNSFLEALLLRPAPAVAAAAFCLLALLGVAWMARRRGAMAAWMVVGPVVMTALASALRRYPFSWRLLQFAVPLAAFWLAAGGWALIEVFGTSSASRWTARAGAALVALTLVAVNVTHPYRTPDTRALVADWSRRADPRTPVYVFPGAVPAWAIYTTDWARPDSAWLAALAGVQASHQADLVLRRAGRTEIVGHYTGIDWTIGSGPSQPHPDSGWAGHEVGRMSAVADGGDIWLIFDHPYRDEVSQLLRAVELQGGVRLCADSLRGASLYRYRLAAGGKR